MTSWCSLSVRRILPLIDLIKKNLNKSPIQDFADKDALVKILYNEEWEIGIVNTNNICDNFICIIAPSFKITLSSCDSVNKGMFNNNMPFVLRAIFLNFKCMKHKGMSSYRSTSQFIGIKH